MDWRIDTPDQAKVFYQALLRRLERENGPVSASVKSYRKPKTRSQVSKITCMCRDVGISQGYDLDTAKAWVKDELGYVRFSDKKDGGVIAVRKSFGDATREEMSILIDRLYALGVEYDVEFYDE